MLAITVEFLHGTFRATDHDDLTITANPKRHGEWPPAPARLFAALIAADGTRDRQRVTSGTGDLAALENAPPPTIVASYGADVTSTLLHERFVVVDERAKAGAVQNYPGRQAQAVWPGAVTSMAWPMVVYEWEDVTLPPELLGQLAQRCARVGYLGCADSPVRVRLGPPGAVPATVGRWTPDRGGDVTLGVPGPGLIDRFDLAFDRFRAGGVSRRSWVAAPLAAYRRPDSRSPAVGAEPSFVWLRFDRAINGRHVVLVAETLKRAVLVHLDRALGGPERVPPIVHGHAPGQEVVRWLPLPHAGYAHADGRIRGACIWLPPGADPWAVAEVADAASRIDRLVCPGVFDVGVTPFDGTPRPHATHPDRWRRGARRLATVFPAVFERRLRRPLALDDIAMWCAHAGLPTPLGFRAAPVPMVPGASQLVPSQVFRRRDQHRPYTHLELWFDEPVRGPAAIGRCRQYGLGLLVPWEGDRDG
jgi:CRISPR-associated protein Csb2